MADSPKNIVHVSQADIISGRTKHITLAEILQIAASDAQLGTVSFQDSEISSSGVDAGVFLSFKLGETTYKLKLYS